MGSSFAPCRPSVDPNAPVITQKASISPSDVHVLLVDDEQISRTLVSSLLRRCNYSGEYGSEGLLSLFGKDLSFFVQEVMKLFK